MVIPFITEIPEWFNYVGVQRNPRFWVRRKFPNVALAMIFHFQDESERDKFARRHLVDLRLLINGRYVPCKGCRSIRIKAEHILICDLRVLFSEKEWLGLGALLEEEWNLVQVEYKATSSLMISGWGAFVYEDGTNMDDLLFTSPDHMIVKEASTSEHTEEEEGYDPQLEEVVREIYAEGMIDALLEAQTRFPALDIVEIKSAALEKGHSIGWTPEGMEMIPLAENRAYMSGVYGGLIEAKLRFPDLDFWKTLNTVINRRGITQTFASPPILRIPQLDWTRVTLPPSHDPLMRIFMMMNGQSTSESEVTSKLFRMLKEQYQIVGNRFAQLESENENVAQNPTGSSRNQYDELIQKFNIRCDELVGKRQYNFDRVAEYEKVRVILKQRAEELERLFVAVVQRLLKLEEFEDLICAIYLNGLRDGILEAQTILLALCMDGETDERVSDEAANNENID